MTYLKKHLKLMILSKILFYMYLLILKVVTIGLQRHSAEEVIEIAKVVGRMGGIHISHMREEPEEVTTASTKPAELVTIS